MGVSRLEGLVADDKKQPHPAAIPDRESARFPAVKFAPAYRRTKGHRGTEGAAARQGYQRLLPGYHRNPPSRDVRERRVQRNRRARHGHPHRSLRPLEPGTAQLHLPLFRPHPGNLQRHFLPGRLEDVSVECVQLSQLNRGEKRPRHAARHELRVPLVCL